MSPVTSPTSSSASSASSPPSSSSPPTHRQTQNRTRTRVSAEHTLTRVRENQRRHRARRKDYIASLEQKLAETEAQLADARAEIAVLRRERERDRAPEQQYLDAGVHEEMMALERLVDALPAPGMDAIFAVPAGLSLGAPVAVAPLQDQSTFVESGDELAITATTGPPPCCEDQAVQPARVPESVECSSCHERPAPAPTESTTLCAQAYVLIAQQNFRGIDAGTIRLWLYQGYRRAKREGEGCRVENGALFRLLDYISGV